MATVTGVGSGNVNNSNTLSTSGFKSNAGDILLIQVGIASFTGAPPNPTITDNNGNSYTLQTNGNETYSTNLVLGAYVYTATNKTNITSLVITISFPSSIASIVASAGSFTGVGTSITSGAWVQSSGSSPSATLSVQANKGATLLACATFINGTSGITPPSGFTELRNSGQSNAIFCDEYYTLGTGSQGTNTATLSSSSGAFIANLIALSPLAQSASIASNPGVTNPGSAPGGAIPITIATGANVLYSQGAATIQTNTLERDVAQTGPSNRKTSITCGIANAKLLMKKCANGILPVNPAYVIKPPEPKEGWFAHLPVNGPDNINVVLPISGNYGVGYFLTDQNNNQRALSGAQYTMFKNIPSTPKSPTVGNNPSTASFAGNTAGLINEPLFNGVIHLVQVNFYNGSNNTVTTPDMQTILAFLNAITPIQEAYASQWGTCGATVDQTIYQATFNIGSGNTTFNDDQLGGNPTNGTPSMNSNFIDNLAATNGWSSGGPTAHCIVVICPPNITNNDCNPANGYLSYHDCSFVYNVPYIYTPLTAEPITATDVSDIYQIPLSHEVAEMTVDPAADLNNPEVCDSCGPNCETVIRNFFDGNGNYITSSAFFIAGVGPGFSYSVMTNSVSAPPYATTAQNTCPTVPYGSCGYSPPGYTNQTSPNPLIPISPLLLSPLGLPTPVLPSGVFNVFTPNGLITGFSLPPNAQGVSAIQLPLTFS
jgi:hypothetical protein